MGVGRVLDEAWGLYTRFFLRFFLIALVVFALVNTVYGLMALALAGDDGLPALTSQEVSGDAMLLWLTGIATGLVGTYWLQGALVFAVQDARDGTIDARLGEVFRSALPHLATLIVVGLLAGIGIGLGLLLLIVPGLLLMTLWAVVAPVVVLEHTGVVAAFGRSRRLVSGHGWTVFAVIVITAVLTALAGGILRGAFGFLPPFPEILVGGTIASAIVAPFTAIALTVMYFLLRDLTSAPGPAPQT
jgi:hypothetical protein